VRNEELTQLAPDLPVTGKTPPTFLAQTQDDGIHVECSLFYYLALKQAGVPSELHIGPKGGHGYGLRPSPEKAVLAWPLRAAEWMKSQGFLQPAK
jgi:acetyl esterase/lipase